RSPSAATRGPNSTTGRAARSIATTCSSGRPHTPVDPTRANVAEGHTMTLIEATRTKTSSGAIRSGRLFLLELSGDRIHSMNPDGSDRKTIVTNCHFPDGVAVDVEAGHIYWTNMGIPSLDDGSIERADLDGGNRRIIVPLGVTHTPKQIH